MTDPKSAPKFKPMLASEADLTKLKFPLLASPKFDGIRCIVHPALGAVSRNLKPIPNEYIRGLLNKHARGLDGEIVVGDPTAKDCFNKTTSAVMRSTGKPEFTFWAFDAPYLDEPFKGAGRMPEFKARLGNVYMHCHGAPGWLKYVEHHWVADLGTLNTFESDLVAAGWEGVMLRDPNGLYKQGRSTVKEGGLLKLKRFSDAEAVVVGFEEQMRNDNEATVDALGHTQRSSHKANLVGKGTLGALRVVMSSHECERFRWSPEAEFTIGTGYTQAMRDDLWSRRDEVMGQVVKFKFQAVGSMDAPRFPVFLGFRPDGA